MELLTGPPVRVETCPVCRGAGLAVLTACRLPRHCPFCVGGVSISGVWANPIDRRAYELGLAPRAANPAKPPLKNDLNPKGKES